MELMTIKNKR